MNAEKLKDLFTEAEEICDVDPNSAVAKYEAIITSNPGSHFIAVKIEINHHLSQFQHSNNRSQTR